MQGDQELVGARSAPAPVAAEVSRLLPSGDEAGSPPADRAFRPDVEGLRAVAILLVVLYHAGLSQLSGGFVGVDVFFVVSGYVITGVLLRERVATGGTSLVSFYARRCRRILPAATLVIIVTVALSYIVLGVVGGDSAAIDGRWAAVFLANFHFASIGANYLNANRLPSPLQNYWSLSVEEQFYLVYPTLFLVATRFKSTVTREARLMIGLGVVIVCSFALSATQTSFNPVFAYYSPFTRAWELALGALVAVGSRWLVQLPKNVAAALTWVGLLGIVTAAFLFNAQTPYPGTAVALPVIGAALIIAGGIAVPRFGAELLLGLPPFSWLGRISYSLYLWHWPILILAAESSGNASLPFSQNLVWLLVALVASGLSYRLVENPIRRSRLLTRRQVASVGMGILLVLVTVVILTVQLNTQDNALLSKQFDVKAVATNQEMAQLLAAAPQITTLPTGMIPPLADAPTDADIAQGAGLCWPTYQQSSGPVCISGDTQGTHTVVLYGDSHAAMWSQAIDEIAQAAHWKLVMLLKSSCPVNMLTYGNPPGWGTPTAEYSACVHWHQWALGVIDRLQPQVLVLSQEVRSAPDSVAYSPRRWGKALQDVLQDVKSRSPRTQEVVLGNIPHLQQAPPECLSRNPDDVQACSSQPKSFYLPYNAAERAAVTSVGGRYVDTTHWFCGTTTCTAVIGRYEVYYDEDHATTTYTVFLKGLLNQAIGLPGPSTGIADLKVTLNGANTGAPISGTQVIDVSASDRARIRSVDLQLTGPGMSDTPIGSATRTLVGYVFSWNTTAVPNGSYELRSRVEDAAGRVAYSKAIPISIDNP